VQVLALERTLTELDHIRLLNLVRRGRRVQPAAAAHHASSASQDPRFGAAGPAAGARDPTLHPTRRCHHLVWFRYGCLEREDVLDVEAIVAWWVRGLALPPHRWLFPAAGRRTPALAASASRATADDTRPMPVQR